MLQRLGLAQALLHEPPMLILDEPTDGLDPLARSQVRSILQGLKKKGTTIFLNSHILQEVELVCDRVAILDRGELRFVGAVKDLATHLQQRAQQQAAAQAAQEGTASAAAQATQLQVDFELEGAEAAIRKALGQRPIQNWQPLGTHQFHVTTRMPDQAAVDRCVDDLRAAGINIIGLSRRRVTLEAAFLEILAEPAE
jgi:ABC-2 type transport system ATP-binding protein